MAAKYFVVLALAAVASALPAVPVAKYSYAEPEAPAHYDFQYSVHDGHSGDVKQQQESRAEDAVHGSYSLVQPDTLGTCQYSHTPTPATITTAAKYPYAKYAYPETEAPAHYDFQYSVHDDHSGDVKPQQESHSGDLLVQPDGVQRIVECSSDTEHGFNANVHYEEHPIQAPVPAKIAYAAPLDKIAYAAPVAKVAYSAPVYHAAPVAKLVYSAPVYHAAPVAKMAYAAPLAQVSYSPPAIAYHH